MISKAIQDANENARKRTKEQQSFDNAEEYSVAVKLNGIRQFVPLGAVEVKGKTIAEYLDTATKTAAKVEDLKKIANTLTQSSAEQANLLQAVVATLKGEKL